jgi:hypothetical protein
MVKSLLTTLAQSFPAYLRGKTEREFEGIIAALKRGEIPDVSDD